MLAIYNDIIILFASSILLDYCYWVITLAEEGRGVAPAAYFCGDYGDPGKKGHKTVRNAVLRSL